jgi:hypothetical protein
MANIRWTTTFLIAAVASVIMSLLSQFSPAHMTEAKRTAPLSIRIRPDVTKAIARLAKADRGACSAASTVLSRASADFGAAPRIRARRA